MISRFFGLALIAALALTPRICLADVDVGTAAEITTEVTVSLGGSVTKLVTGDHVFQNQVIVTNGSGIGQIEFVDKTKLAIGPGSTVTLDRFVYDPDKSATKIAISLGKGTFRFITGTSPHDAYDISTPTATLGLRGTAFDVYVAEDGEMAVAMINGEINACSKRTTQCQLHSLVGKFLRITPDGVLSIHDKWDGTFLHGVGFAEALPFMANQNVLRPAFKTTTRVVGLYVKTAAKVLKAPIKAVEPVGKFFKKLNPFK